MLYPIDLLCEECCDTHESDYDALVRLLESMAEFFPEFLVVTVAPGLTGALASISGNTLERQVSESGSVDHYLVDDGMASFHIAPSAVKAYECDVNNWRRQDSPEVRIYMVDGSKIDVVFNQ